MTPSQYRLVLRGEVGARYASAFQEMTVSAHDGITEITGEIIDSSHLQGLLDRIAGLGLTLHSLTPLDTDSGEATPHSPEPSTKQPGTHLKGP